jgi:hypothetical protein
MQKPQWLCRLAVGNESVGRKDLKWIELICRLEPTEDAYLLQLYQSKTVSRLPSRCLRSNLGLADQFEKFRNKKR